MHFPVLLTTSILSLAIRASGSTTFTLPAGNMGTEGDYSNVARYPTNQAVVFSWDTDLDKVGVLMYQIYPEATGNYKRLLRMLHPKPAQNAPNNLANRCIENSAAKKVQWTVTTDWLKNLGDDGLAVLSLSIFEEGDSNADAKSAYFNVTTTESTCHRNCYAISADAISSTTSASTSSKASSTGGSTTASEAQQTVVTVTNEGKTVTMTQDAATDATAIETSADAAGEAAATAASGSTQSPTATASSKSTSGSPSMSTGKIAGISVGSILGVLSLLGGTGFGWRRHRKRKAKAQAIMMQQSMHGTQSTHINITQAAAPVASSTPPPAEGKPSTAPTTYSPHQKFQSPSPPQQQWNQPPTYPEGYSQNNPVHMAGYTQPYGGQGFGGNTQTSYSQAGYNQGGYNHGGYPELDSNQAGPGYNERQEAP